MSLIASACVQRRSVCGEQFPGHRRHAGRALRDGHVAHLEQRAAAALANDVRHGLRLGGGDGEPGIGEHHDAGLAAGLRHGGQRRRARDGDRIGAHVHRDGCPRDGAGARPRVPADHRRQPGARAAAGRVRVRARPIRRSRGRPVAPPGRRQPLGGGRPPSRPHRRCAPSSRSRAQPRGCPERRRARRRCAGLRPTPRRSCRARHVGPDVGPVHAGARLDALSTAWRASSTASAADSPGSSAHRAITEEREANCAPTTDRHASINHHAAAPWPAATGRPPAVGQHLQPGGHHSAPVRP